MDIMYLVFFFPQYYPTGGMNDCIGKASTLEEAKKIKAEQLEDDMSMGTVQIYDIEDDRVL